MLVLLLSGCGPSGPLYPVNLVVEDAASPLTTSPGDALCDLLIISVDQPRSVTSLEARLIGPVVGGGCDVSAILPFELALDANGDGRVGAGDTLRIFEQSDVNLYDPSLPGSAHGVSLTANPRDPDTEELLFSGGAWLAN